MSGHGAGAPPRGDAPATVDALMACVRSTVARVWGFTTFRDPQDQVIASVVAGRNAVALMPTGCGKTLCFAAPAVALPGLAVVVSPLIALIQDQVTALRARGVAAVALTSTTPAPARHAVYADLACVHPTTKLLYITPEGAQTERLMTALTKLAGRGGVSLVAIDEAHCISSWGHDFRPAYKALGAFRTRFPGVPTLALTATATPAVLRDMVNSLDIPDAIIHRRSFDRPNLAYTVLFKEAYPDPVKELADRIVAALKAPASLPARDGWDGAAGTTSVGASASGPCAVGIHPSRPRTEAGYTGTGTPDDPLVLEEEEEEEEEAETEAEAQVGGNVGIDSGCHDGVGVVDGRGSGELHGCAVVYTHKREEAADMARMLTTMYGLPAVAYHAGMKEGERSAAQASWMAGQVRVVVATVAFGMGIDKADVRLVAHFNLPKSLDGYYQEAGRAGRDGAPATCLLLYSRDDRDRIEFVTKQGVAKRQAAAAAAVGEGVDGGDGLPRAAGVGGKRGRMVEAGEREGSSDGGGGDMFDPLAALKAVTDYCETPACRRVAVLQHFGETPAFKSCTPALHHQLCDYCTNPKRVAKSIKLLHLGLLARQDEVDDEGRPLAGAAGAPGWPRRDWAASRFSGFGTGRFGGGRGDSGLSWPQPKRSRTMNEEDAEQERDLAEFMVGGSRHADRHQDEWGLDDGDGDEEEDLDSLAAGGVVGYAAPGTEHARWMADTWEERGGGGRQGGLAGLMARGRGGAVRALGPRPGRPATTTTATSSMGSGFVSARHAVAAGGGEASRGWHPAGCAGVTQGQATAAAGGAASHTSTQGAALPPPLTLGFVPARSLSTSALVGVTSSSSSSYSIASGVKPALDKGRKKGSAGNVVTKPQPSMLSFFGTRPPSKPPPQPTPTIGGGGAGLVAAGVSLASVNAYALAVAAVSRAQEALRQGAGSEQAPCVG